jgi:hypothetical protein
VSNKDDGPVLLLAPSCVYLSISESIVIESIDCVCFFSIQAVSFDLLTRLRYTASLKNRPL